MTTAELRDLDAARASLRRALNGAEVAPISAPPATRLRQIGGMESAVEQRFCDETLGILLDQGEVESLLVVDLSTVGRASAVWLGRVLPLLRQRAPQARITFALPATRQAGRGRLLARHLAEAQDGGEVELLCGPSPLSASTPPVDELDLIRRGFDRILALALSGTAGLTASWPEHPGRPWLELAHAAVMSFVAPTAVLDDLDHLHALWPARKPLPWLQVQGLESDTPTTEAEVELTSPDLARQELAPLLDAERRSPWRLVVAQAPDTYGTSLACPNEAAAGALTSPLQPRRIVRTGRIHLVASHRDGDAAENDGVDPASGEPT